MRLGQTSSYILGSVLTVALTSCKTGSSPDTGGDTPAKKPGGNGEQTSPTPPSTDTAPATGLQQTDVIIISAVGSENISQAQALSTNLSLLVSALAKKSTANNQMKLALIASTVAGNSGVKASLSGPNSLQVNFELAAKDAFLGTLVAGCNPANSSLDSTHTAGTVKVCGDQITIPAHSWAWAVDDLKGKLQGFLRPTANRIYILVANNDPTIVTSKQFIKLAQAQGAKSVKLFAVAPQTVTGICNSQNKPTPVIAQTAQALSGRVFYFCQADWSQHISEIVSAI